MWSATPSSLKPSMNGFCPPQLLDHDLTCHIQINSVWVEVCNCAYIFFSWFWSYLMAFITSLAYIVLNVLAPAWSF
jgi:hypothetical protein